MLLYLIFWKVIQEINIINQKHGGMIYMKLIGLSGSLIGEKTSKLVSEVLNQAKHMNPNIEIELIDLRNYRVEFVDGRPLTSYNNDTQMIVRKILEADCFVIGTPIYQASITGVLKNLFDHLPTNVFESKIVGIVTTGGSNKHFLVGENQLKPILSFFKSIIPSNNVFAHSSCFDKDSNLIDEDIINRVRRLAKEILFFQERIND